MELRPIVRDKEIGFYKAVGTGKDLKRRTLIALGIIILVVMGVYLIFGK